MRRIMPNVMRPVSQTVQTVLGIANGRTVAKPTRLQRLIQATDDAIQNPIALEEPSLSGEHWQEGHPTALELTMLGDQKSFWTASSEMNQFLEKYYGESAVCDEGFYLAYGWVPNAKGSRFYQMAGKFGGVDVAGWEMSMLELMPRNPRRDDVVDGVERFHSGETALENHINTLVENDVLLARRPSIMFECILGMIRNGTISSPEHLAYLFFRSGALFSLLFDHRTEEGIQNGGIIFEFYSMYFDEGCSELSLERLERVLRDSSFAKEQPEMVADMLNQLAGVGSSWQEVTTFLLDHSEALQLKKGI